jgi:type II secretory pathway component GspD/PulD (secretin)
MSISWIRIAALCLLGFMPAAVLAAPISDEVKADFPAEKLRKALQQPVTIEIVDQPLEVAIQQLKEQTKLNFTLDRAALAANDPNNIMIGPGGIPIPNPNGATQNVTIKAKDRKLRDTLKSMLSGNNLTFVVIGDTVLITSEDLAVQRQLKQRVSLDLDGVSLSQAVKQLARETGANLVLDPKMKKEAEAAVTLQMEDVPLETAMRLLCEMGGMKPVRMGNVLYITSKANAAELRADPDLAPQPAGPPGIPGINNLGLWGGIGFGGMGGMVPPPAVAPPPPAPEPGEKEKPTDKPS